MPPRTSASRVVDEGRVDLPWKKRHWVGEDEEDAAWNGFPYESVKNINTEDNAEKDKEEAALTLFPY